MPHVGVERLGAGHAQKYGAQHEERPRAAAPKIGDPVERINGRDDRGMSRDPVGAEGRDRREPDEHDRAEARPILAVPSGCAANRASRTTTAAGRT